VDEESPTNPQTAYAVCKTLVERDVGAMADDGFSPTFLRNSTAYGGSPRMRFDIVLNNLSGLAWTTGQIRMESDGTPWRPFVHIRDIATSIACALEAPREVVHNEIFNVGNSRANYQIREIADVVGAEFPNCKITLAPGGGPDTRSYRVSFDKINDRLPAFACAWDAALGAQELHQIFERIDMTADDFGWRGFTRLKQIEYLIRTAQIDHDFFWTP
jgi:nucleoside-diphosphate-sugar epimerase